MSTQLLYAFLPQRQDGREMVNVSLLESVTSSERPWRGVIAYTGGVVLGRAVMQPASSQYEYCRVP